MPMLSAAGMSSSRVMNIITPPAKAREAGTRPWKVFRNIVAISAPTGSTRPEKSAILAALHLFISLLHNGRAVAIPSGILCSMIAVAINMPNWGACIYPAPTAIPSGRLWIVIPMVSRRPVLNSCGSVILS
jgi:hypothetical protein